MQERTMNPLQMDNFNFNNSVKRSENDTWPFYILLIMLQDFMIVTTRKYKIIQCMISNK